MFICATSIKVHTYPVEIYKLEWFTDLVWYTYLSILFSTSYTYLGLIQ